MPLTIASRIASSQQWADPVAEKLQPLIRRAVSKREVRNFLDGVWLGAPLHPALTDVPVGAWTAAPVLDEAELHGDELRQVEVGGVPVLLARTSDGEVCALANTCTHLGGPLAEGSRDGDTVTCPWHGSCFDLRSGGVIRGPAVFAQPRLEARVRDGRIEVGTPATANSADELPELSNLEPVGTGS